ncbi:MAG: ATP-binding protein [Bacteroidales bacterium]|nr:ATP-binding protein [Bacteroidales bacterium]
MHIDRLLKTQIISDLEQLKKVILLYGPRQAGKTTLSRHIIQEIGLKTLMINADQSKYIEVLSSRDLGKLKSLVAGYELLFIDEGQRIPEIGINLKILHDELPELKILITGSSSFLLSGRVSESLAGRKKIYTLLPLSMQELAKTNNNFELNYQLEERLIFGSYPEVANNVNHAEKEDYLRDISSSLIYKDILELEMIKYPLKIRDLLKLLAYQVGSQVSLHELGIKLGLNRETVERYLFLLEQSFVIFKLPAFSHNPRKEISKSQKYYFYDTGIRNILIDNMKYLNDRNDSGALWENFIIAERRKYLFYNKMNVNCYFWRTYSGTEIDYVEEFKGEYFAYEIKSGKSKTRIPLSWSSEYGSNYLNINKDNYLEFIL